MTHFPMAVMIILLNPYFKPLELPNIDHAKTKTCKNQEQKKNRFTCSNYTIFNEISSVQMIRQNYKPEVGRLPTKPVVLRLQNNKDNPSIRMHSFISNIPKIPCFLEKPRKPLLLLLFLQEARAGGW